MCPLIGEGYDYCDCDLKLVIMIMIIVLWNILSYVLVITIEKCYLELIGFY